MLRIRIKLYSTGEDKIRSIKLSYLLKVLGQLLFIPCLILCSLGSSAHSNTDWYKEDCNNTAGIYHERGN